MADSDEEHDRKKRDKFRRERSDYNERRRSDHGDRRPSWKDEYYEARRRSRDAENGGDRHRDRGGSPLHSRRNDWSPPDKRFRRREGGWESLHDVPPPMMGGPFGMMDHRAPPPWLMPGEMPPSHRGSHMSPGSRSLPGELMMGGFPSPADTRQSQRGNVLLSFKQFLLSQQDDGIEESEAVRLYQEYKSDFKKKQLHQFFNDHKEEDWFLSKYHPKHLAKIEEIARQHIDKRIQVFQTISNQIKDVSLVVSGGEGNDDIIHVMDTAVILMEGGTELDLKCLDKSYKEEKEEEKDEELKEESERKGIKRKREEVEENEDDSTHTKSKKTDEQSGESSPNDTTPHSTSEDIPQTSEMETNTPEAETNTAEAETTETETNTAETETNTAETETNSAETEANTAETEADTAETEADTTEIQTTTAETETSTAETDTTTGTETNTDATKTEADTTETDTNTAQTNTKPRPLHLTKAVYIRHVTPHISVNDIIEVCKAIPGFLRIGLAEPQPERGFERRGWVTFSNDVNIKEVCTKIGTRKIKNTVLTCQINRDLSRRVKVSSSITWARRAVESDVQLLRKLIDFYDKKCKLWIHAAQKSEEEIEEVKVNPVMNIKETSPSGQSSNSTESKDKQEGEEGEREEGEGEMGEGEGEIGEGEGEIVEGDEEGLIVDPGTEILKLDSPLVQTLDLLIWYLRLVHSVDYYNGTVFTDEDMMPHRCGIMTARPHPPKAVTNEEVNEYIKTAEGRAEPLLKEKTFLEEEELDKLGKRDHESEVEKFIEVNTQKLGENKYLCPLSGKKFRGPEFVRKHILNKHSHALEEVRSEADFFNNYLKDPDRPVPLESSIGGGGGVGEERRDKGMGGRMWGGFHGDMGGGGMRRGGGRGGRPFRGGFRGGDNRRGRRPVRSYNDLDMPDDMY